MIKRLAGTFVLALSVAAFAGSAIAGNGHGNGNGDGKDKGDGAAPSAPVAGDSSPGNSANAPGHEKKEAESAQPAPAEASVAADQSAANSEGVKPSSTTEHDTHAAASSGKTKQYGNGKTAGQIAIQNGAAATAILHGPGNSQPHKVAPCSGGHEVDVHALKGKGHRKACGTPTPPVGPTPVPAPGSISNPNHSSDPKPNTSGPAADPGNVPADPGGSAPAGGVGSSSVETGSQGVLAAAAVVGRGSLPFTGFPLWGVVLVALMLLALGLALRRRAGATVKERNR